MDTTTRLSFLQGNLRIRACEITPEEWSVLIQEVITWCKPHLKYLDGFNTLASHLHSLEHRQESDNARCGIVIPADVTTYTSDIGGGETQAILIKEFQSNDRAGSGKQVRNFLFLSQKGNLIWWKVICYRKPEEKDGVGKISIATSSEFRLMWRDNEIESLLSDHPSMGRNIIEFLSQLLKKKSAELQSTVDNLNQKRSKITELEKRIGI